MNMTLKESARIPVVEKARVGTNGNIAKNVKVKDILNQKNNMPLENNLRNELKDANAKLKAIQRLITKFTKETSTHLRSLYVIGAIEKILKS